MSTTFWIGYDEYNFVNLFECKNMEVQENTTVSIDFFYDMAYDTAVGVNVSRAYVEAGLLQQLASYYGLWDGNACDGPLPNRTWFVQLASLPIDTVNPHFESCYELQPKDGEGCVSMMASMSGEVAGNNTSILDTVETIALQLNSGAATQGASMRVLFIGTELNNTNVGKDNLPPAISLSEVNQTSEAAFKEDVTGMGIVIVAGLTLAVIGFIFVLVRKRRRSGRALEAHQKLEGDGLDKSVVGNKDNDDREVVGVISLPPEQVYDQEERDVDEECLNQDDNLPDSPDDFKEEYTFDLGGWMKSELLGIHGNSYITATPSQTESVAELPSPIREQGETDISDSDNDSWAQTEATIGSLELRLDPIEAEV